MIRSFSMSRDNFLTSLILSHQEIPVEYKLMTCLPKAFPVCSSYSFGTRVHPVFSVRFVYDLITCRVHPFLPYVHLCPNKCALLLSMTPFKHSCFLCCSMSSFGVSTTSPKKSSSFNIFIKCRN